MKRFKKYLKLKFLGLVKSLVKDVGRDLNKVQESTFRELERIAYRESASFISQHLEKAVLFTNDVEFWTRAINAAPKNGLVLEFGVFQGRSINIFADVLNHDDDSRKIYGFDAFEGLSEDFTGTTMPKKMFSVEGQLPVVAESVELKKGWVDKTLPEFMMEHGDKLAFMNVDFDTYTPTKIVFENLVSRFQKGSIIVFDELLGFPNWREHEHKVLMEMMPENCEYEFISFCEILVPQFIGSYIKAAIRITKTH